MSISAERIREISVSVMGSQSDMKEFTPIARSRYGLACAPGSCGGGPGGACQGACRGCRIEFIPKK